MTHSITTGLLFVWLIAETVWDFKNPEIPRWFSIIPLSLGLIAFALGSGWGALLLAASILATNITHPWPRRGLVIVPAILVGIWVNMPLAAGWLLLYLAWELNILGGADALAGLYLLVWFPVLPMLATLIAGLFLWNLGSLILRHGRETGLHLWTTITNKTAATRAPGMGAFLIALFLFVLSG
ncbi:MAG: hypothetical protein KJ638_00600 [Chloroflexi bacterium]|nr:hypothetical protein [Chloroflexota bacterium]